MSKSNIDHQYPNTWPNPPEPKPVNPDAVFQVAVDITLNHEGGYVNHPQDPGGETNFGISRRSYPDVDIAALTRETARDIYYTDFWLKPRLDKLAAIAPDLAIRLFDLAVNCGPVTAVKFLQRGVNTVCLDRAAAIRVDGFIGPKTLKTIEQCPHEAALMAALKGEAYHHYTRQNHLYIAGWLNRLES